MISRQAIPARHLMSHRHPYETKTIASFIDHLAQTTGARYQIEAEHVPVGTKNCDFVLADAAGKGPELAVELVRIVDSPTAMKDHSLRSALWEALRKELATLGMTDLLVDTPWKHSWTPRELNGSAGKELAARLKAAFDARPGDKGIEVDGFTLHQIPGLGFISFGSHASASWVNQERLAESILDTLADKDAQINVPGCRRIVIAVEMETMLNAKEITQQFALRDDLHRLVHTDEAFFADRNGAFHSIYRRDVRDYFLGTGPYPPLAAEMVDLWFAERLMHNQPETFALARSQAAKTGLGFLLTATTRTALAHCASELVKNGDHDAGLWVMRELAGDPDPPEPTDYDGTIVTVRGTVAWLTAALASRVEATVLPEVLGYVERLAADSNRYVRRLAAIALKVLVARRDSFSEGRPILDEQIRANILAAALEFTRAADDDALTRAAARVFAHAFDLTPTQVHEIIDRLLARADHDALGDLARLLCYFAAMRESDPTFSALFDASTLKAKLKDLVLHNGGFRDAVAFVTFKTTEGDVRAAAKLGPLVALLLQTTANWRSAHFPFESFKHIVEAGHATPDLEFALVDAVRRCLSDQCKDGFREFSIKHFLKPALASLRHAGRPHAADRVLELLGPDAAAA
jgi:hypothetical protein